MRRFSALASIDRWIPRHCNHRQAQRRGCARWCKWCKWCGRWESLPTFIQPDSVTAYRTNNHTTTPMPATAKAARANKTTTTTPQRPCPPQPRQRAQTRQQQPRLTSHTFWRSFFWRFAARREAISASSALRFFSLFHCARVLRTTTTGGPTVGSRGRK